ncbi:MAG: substrate-binding domain-containing protein [Candidatus Paceibacterota bacterium]|jgi:D-xylose transport system substrate-binding protein
MKKSLIAVLVLALVGFGGLIFTFLRLSSSDRLADKSKSLETEKILIGFSLGTSREERWLKDAEFFMERANELGAIVEVKYSGEDPDFQISQAENLIIQGAKALVVVPNDAVTAARIVEKAHAAGVKVIAYDRMITGSDVDLYISFDGRKLGELQALEITRLVPKGKLAYIGGSPTDNNAFLLKEGSMKVVDPLVKKGDIMVVLDTFSLNWQPEEAYKALRAYLDTGKTVDAVIAANDSTAGGAVRALKEFGLEGKVPVSGQDADLAACQRIVVGTQAMTIYKPLKMLAYTAAEAAVDFAMGKIPLINGTLNNGKTDVPSHFLDPVVVTKENMDAIIIDAGFHSREDVYGAR